MAQQGILAVLLLLTQSLPGLNSDSCALNGDPRVNNLLTQMLASFKPTDTPNPSILLALRLASDHNLEVESAMVQRIKEDAVYRVMNNQDFTSGTVALYVMALQASCENPRVVSAPNSTIDLVQLLKDKYELELKSIEDFKIYPPQRPESEPEGESRPLGDPGKRNMTEDFEIYPAKRPESEAEGESRPPRGPGKGNLTESEEKEDSDENSRDNSDEDSDEEVHGKPLTNYYQIGLNILALCLQDISVNLTNVLEASCSKQRDGSQLPDGSKQHDGFGDKFSVDTAAVMVLGLNCVANSRDLAPSDKMAVNSTLTCLVQKIIKSKQEDGVMGNIYSTGLAMQALSVSADYYTSSDWNCSQTLLAASEAITKGEFNNPMAASQITPSLQGRTYLDIRGLNCSADQDNLPIVSPPPNPSVSNLSEIVLTYRVVDNVSHSFDYSLTLNVPGGSTFLQVMETAQSANPQQFSFTTKFTSSGYSVESINGLAADTTARTYWQLQSRNTPLTEDVAEYKPQEGELLVAIFTTW